ncbi:hypothetical protein chiPu_0014826 [Chiloscyllium punctatum]|uniref:Uncharacterized protein n=1 Tax=Chiloscyllium punctatum TaxID=137246 RepID=A0A401T0Z6_CHIPU|nr:hypothetical protein [Chiloscyllium punctatum]
MVWRLSPVRSGDLPRSGLEIWSRVGLVYLETGPRAAWKLDAAHSETGPSVPWRLGLVQPGDWALRSLEIDPGIF